MRSTIAPPGRSPEPPEDADLLAGILGSGTRYSARSGTWLGLASCTEAQLMAMLAIRRPAARRLRLAFALHRRLLATAVPEPQPLVQPEQVAVVMRPLVQIDHERLWCLPLDPRCRLIGEPIEVARGDVDGTSAGPRLVCRAALRAGAVSMIVVHNHPSGDPSPSAADLAVTRLLAAAGRAVDVPLHDHLVVCADGRFTSLRRDQPAVFC